MFFSSLLHLFFKLYFKSYGLPSIQQKDLIRGYGKAKKGMEDNTDINKKQWFNQLIALIINGNLTQVGRNLRQGVSNHSEILP